MKKCLLVLAVLLCGASLLFAAGKVETSVPKVSIYFGSTEPQEFLDDIATISKYAEEKIGIGFTAPNADGSRMGAMVQSGEAFDLMFLDGGDFKPGVDMGAYWNMSGVIQTLTPALYATIPQILWDQGTYKGGLYAIPTGPGLSSTAFFIWDKGVVDQYGGPNAVGIYDTSLTGLDKSFRYLQSQGVAHPNPSGKSGSNLGWATWLIDDAGIGAPALGVRIDDPEMKVINLLETPEVLEQLKTVRQWHLDGIYNPEHTIHDGSYYPQIWTSGTGWPGAAPIWAGWGHNDQGVYVAEYVGGPKITSGSGMATAFVIGANSKYKEESLKLLELLYTDRTFRDMLGYGIEGKHFEYVKKPTSTSAGVVRKLRTDQNAWALPVYKTGPSRIYTPTGAMQSLLSDTEDDPNKQNEQADQENRAIRSVLLGFNMDVTPFLNERAQMWPIWDKYADMFMGATDYTTELPRLIAELKSVGMDKVIAEAQRQIDAWKAGR